MKKKFNSFHLISKNLESLQLHKWLLLLTCVSTLKRQHLIFKLMCTFNQFLACFCYVGRISVIVCNLEGKSVLILSFSYIFPLGDGIAWIQFWVICKVMIKTCQYAINYIQTKLAGNCCKTILWSIISSPCNMSKLNPEWML